jgi:hypothetical protein
MAAGGAGVDVGLAQEALAVPGAGRLGAGGYALARSAVGSVVGAVEGVVAVAEGAVAGAGFGGFGALDAAGDAAGALAQGGVARGYARRASVNLNNAGS